MLSSFIQNMFRNPLCFYVEAIEFSVGWKEIDYTQRYFKRSFSIPIGRFSIIF